jgi:hypothetical protein
VNKALDLHNESTAKSFLALQAKKRNDFAEFLKLTKEAFTLERKAALLLKDNLKAEPTRSVLFRSAATLAINSGEYSEAIRLISFAFIGDPHEEIREELLEVIERATYESEASKQNKDENAYLEFLRDKAINIKIEPKIEYYRKAIVVDSILDTLKNLRTSIENYVEVNFKKSFSETDFMEFHKVLEGVKRDYRPLCVNLKFQSFGASICVDDAVNFKEYNPKILEWKKGLFDKYKNEVIDINYESSGSLKEIIDKYSDEERNLIYNPIVDSLKDKNRYRVSLTDKNFRSVEKTLKPISKTTQDILVPKIKKEIEPISKTLIQSWALAEGPDKVSKKDIFKSSEMEYAEFTNTISDVSFEKEYLVVKEPYQIKIVYKKPHFTIEDNTFEIFTRAETFSEVIMSYNKILINIYKKFKIPNPEFSVEENVLKENLDKTFTFISGAAD